MRRYRKYVNHRRRSREEWERIVKRWKESGLPGHTFAQHAGVGHHALRRWATKLNNNIKPSP